MCNLHVGQTVEPVSEPGIVGTIIEVREDVLRPGRQVCTVRLDRLSLLIRGMTGRAHSLTPEYQCDALLVIPPKPWRFP